MTRYFLIMFLILSIVLVNTLSSENTLPSEPMKKGFTGCCLGSISIGCLGLPGTYGWGNFYADDYTGWLILEIGGSTSSILFITTAIGGGPTYLTIIGAIGTVAFSVASVIWGTISTDRYNKRVWDANHRFTYDFTPKKDGGMEFGINYRL